MTTTEDLAPQPGRAHNLPAIFWSSALVILLGDVATKEVARRALVPEHIPHDVVGSVLRFTLVYNPGAAFGFSLGPASRWIFSVLSVLAVWILWRLYRQSRPGDWARALATGLVIGGALGNLVNRLWSERGVVDWIDVGVGGHRWPTFNVADIGVSIGAFLLAWVLWDEEPGAATPTPRP